MISVVMQVYIVILYGISIYILLFSLLGKKDPGLYRVLVICLFAHLCLLGVIQFVLAISPDSRRTIFASDGEFYSMHARIIASILKGEPLSYTSTLEAVNPWVSEYTLRGVIPYARTYQVGYITFFYALIYSIFGYCPIMINLWNISLHLLSGILVFKISRFLFDKKTGYIASGLFLFNPTLFYYSTTKIAESANIFLICLIIYFSLSLSRSKKHVFSIFIFLEILASLYLFYLLKLKLVFAFLATLMAYFIVLISSYLNKIKYLFVSIILFFTIFHAKISHFLNQLFCSLAKTHFAYMTSGGQVYSLLKWGNNIDNYSIFQKINYIFLSWFHFIFEPLNYNSTLYLIYYPFRIAFIILFIMAIMGMIYSLKYKNINALLLILYFFLMGSIIAAASGNTGTMLRHRDAVTFVIFIFAAFFIKESLISQNRNNKV